VVIFLIFKLNTFPIEMSYTSKYNQKQQHTPALMFLGTGSDVGKSILTAALCRILLQDGHDVAPFKAQNMSLNSFVTRDGLEMGRAQVVQAQACRLDPDVRMNPILLKPSSDTGSQVIINGKPVSNMQVDQYIAYKPKAFAAAQKAYDSLASEHEIMILEGAGSCAEVNLKHHDIVNMQMARYANAQVLLIGDIDRGGVFASFVGTMEILAQWERDLVAGYIINRFRGKKELLNDAFVYMKKRTGKPVLGVVDYLKNHGLPEEDSVGFKTGLFDKSPPTGDHVTIGLIDLPHISNFTDFEPFLAEPDVHLKIIRSPKDLLNPDAIIIPGSKNVIDDLDWLHKTGLAQALNDLNQNTEIVGICGGFQMLGNSIADPHHIESAGETRNGLGLLNIKTVLEKEKTLTRKQGTHLASGLPVHGYEIHHGQSVAAHCDDLIHYDGGEPAGVLMKDSGTMWGSYLHGIFDADDFRRWFIDRLREKKGLQPTAKILAPYNLEPAFDRLADAVRSQIDMDAIYRILGP
jgi:cobyric acid synthase CobQ